MLTPQAAMDAGLPVYIACAECHAPSRPLDLKALLAAGKADLDIESAAKRGAFRCTACQSRKAVVMPILADLVRKQCRLHRRCLRCGHERHLTAIEAVIRFGFATPLDELRAAEVRRCHASGCGLTISFAATADVLRKQQFGVTSGSSKSAKRLSARDPLSRLI
jgi:hypothetical protein